MTTSHLKPEEPKKDVNPSRVRASVPVLFFLGEVSRGPFRRHLDLGSRRRISHSPSIRSVTDGRRICRFEEVESRQLLSASPSPIHVGVIHFGSGGGAHTAGLRPRSSRSRSRLLSRAWSTASEAVHTNSTAGDHQPAAFGAAAGGSLHRPSADRLEPVSLGLGRRRIVRGLHVALERYRRGSAAE